jgi:4-hydroxy-3-polyprenylbenzoate decarboxylase
MAIRALEVLRTTDIETHLVVSPAAKITIAQETDWKVSDVLDLADVVYQHQDISAAIASGSFETMGMIVLPCSVKTLSSIANAYNENLLTRAADVTLKEGRSLLLALRETPLHHGHIRLMDLAAGIHRRHG